MSSTTPAKAGPPPVLRPAAVSQRPRRESAGKRGSGAICRVGALVFSAWREHGLFTDEFRALILRYRPGAAVEPLPLLLQFF